MMEIEKFDYIFRIRDHNDVAVNLASIYNNVAYSKFDKTVLYDIFGTSQEDVLKNNYLQYFSDIIKKINDHNNEDLNEKILYLNHRWQSYRQTYYEIVEHLFNIDFKPDVINNLYCQLQYLPINEICVEDGAIYLNCNQSNNQIFVNFIVMLTKFILLQYWHSYNKWQFNTDFDMENKIFMFADIAVDALFYNSELKRVCENPSYKYFYKLNYQNLNMMELFRQKYKNMKIDKFLDEVYLFVYDNYQSLTQFKHYLY